MYQEINVEEKLRSLYDLQLIDYLVDEIKSIIDSIPLQIKAIENEVETIQKKYKEIREEIKEYDRAIQHEKALIKEYEIFIKKFTSKQDKLRNNIESIDIDKEIEFKELEIELCHKKWKKIKSKKDIKKNFYANFADLYEKKKEYLSYKEKEFEKILEKQEKKKRFLLKKASIFSKKIDPRLLQMYCRIRARTKLAVVPIRKGSPIGSFFTIPTQKCLDIAQRKMIVMDEHSGRILIDPVLAEEEATKVFTNYKNELKWELIFS